MPPKGKVNWSRVVRGWTSDNDPRKPKRPTVRIDAARPIYKKPPVPEKILSNPRKTNLVGANGHGIRKIPPPPANKAKK